MKKILYITLFIGIFLLGGILRFYQLGAIPNSLDWDEVSWGYNAFSILTTGKDEYGISYPLSFKAFGDYKQPVYVYADVLPIQWFGLNAFSVRFPSAFFGTLSIPFVFLLVYELFRKRKFAVSVAFLSMFLFAISPWHIQFSRIAFESVLGLFFVLLGTWVFLYSIRFNKSWLLILSAAILALSAYSYHAQKLFTPLFVVGLVIFAKDFFLKHRKLFFLFGICFVVFNSFWLLDARTTARGKSVLFTSEQTSLLQHSLSESQVDLQQHDVFFATFHNRRLVYIEKFFINYLDHFDPNWLFITGDIARHHAPNMGLLYLLSLPCILIGLYMLLSSEKSSAYILGYWFLLAPISGSLVTGAPNAERALIMLPIWQILEALGVIFLLQAIKKEYFRNIVLVCIGILYFGFFVLYINRYFIHTNTDYDRYWQYGYQQAIDFIKQPEFAKTPVYFDNSIEQAYVFYLFYVPVNPTSYLAHGGSNNLQQHCFTITNAFFGSCQEKMKKGDLLITSSSKNTSGYQLLKMIPFFQSDPAVYIYRFEYYE